MMPLFLAAGCSDRPASPVSESNAPLFRTADKASDGDITPQGIAREVVGYTIDVDSVDGQTPSVEWTFDADELRQVKILEQQITSDAATLTVFMMTRSNPEKDEEVLELSGKLNLRYERRGTQWVLKSIENLTFRYALGIST